MDPINQRIKGVLDLLDEQRTKWGTSISRNSHYLEVYDHWNPYENRPRLIGEVRDYDRKVMMFRPDGQGTLYSMVSILNQLPVLEFCTLDLTFDARLISILHKGELVAKFQADREGHYLQAF
jgi:hypothetical protein